MKKNVLCTWSKKLLGSVKRRSPELLLGLGLFGMGTTVVMAVKATPKAMRLLEEQKQKTPDAKVPVKEVVKATWKCYIPAAVTGVTSAACILGSHHISHKRGAVLATAYSLSQTALQEYQSKVIETVGEKKERSIRDDIAKDKLVQTPVTDKEVIVTKKGDTLCFDSISGRYFKSDMETIKRVENELNRRMRNEMFISLNDFYQEIGLDGIPLGYGLGWNIEQGYIDIFFSSQLAADGTPCLVIEHRVAPKHGYTEW